MLKIGVIGLGTVSVVHLRAINDSQIAELTAVCDVDETRMTEAPGIPFYTNVEDMLANENLDVVHVLLPHYLHDSVALQCAKAGVNVFLEKPVSVNYARSQELANEIAQLDNGVKVGICFQNRRNKSVLKLKEVLAADGEPVYAVKGLVAWLRPETYYQTKPWRGNWAEAGSGTIINQSIHTLDLMHYVIEKDWESCKAMVGNMTDYDIEVEDTAVANFQFEDNVKGVFFATNAYEGNDSIELQVFTKANRYTIKDNKLFDSEFNCLAEDDRIPNSKIYYGPSHATAIERFYNAIINQTEDYCTIDSALETMQMIDVMKQSSEAGKTITKGAFLNG